MKKILIIQTAFIGDVILATSFLAQVAKHYPAAQITLLVRKGNESLLQDNPHLHKLYVWNKQRKWSSFLQILREIRKEKFDLLFNLQRFFTTTVLSLLSRAQIKVGFSSHWLSFFYDHPIEHRMDALHEVQRNYQLLMPVIDQLTMKRAQELRPELYLNSVTLPFEPEKNYLVLAPFSVWATKAWPEQYWRELIEKVQWPVILIGSAQDAAKAEQSFVKRVNGKQVDNYCGKLNLLQSALLMKGAQLVIANDSAPLHLASAVNAPTLAIFCSTSAKFGFTPLASVSKVLQVSHLPCHPCGLHGQKACPLVHFRCGYDLKPELVLHEIKQLIKV